MHILAVLITSSIDDPWRHSGSECHLTLSSCPSHVSSDFMAGRSFDKQGLHTVEAVGLSEKTIDWISFVTLLLMSLGRRWNPFEDAQCKQLLTISGLFVTGMLLLYGVAASSDANFAIFTPSPPLTCYISKKARGFPQDCRSIQEKSSRLPLPLVMWGCCFRFW